MKRIIKKSTAIISAALISFLVISCASKDDSDYDYTYDYTEDESSYINDSEPVATENFLANIEPIELDSLFFLKKSGKKVKPREVTKVGLIPRTNAVEFHFRDGSNDIAVIWRKAERDKILDACNTFLQQYEEKSVPHVKVSRKNAYFTSTCSLWFGLLSPAIGCEKNTYYVIPEFIDKKPYLLIRFVPTETTSADSNAYTPKVSLYMSPSQIRDFVEAMNQEKLEASIQDKKKKAYTY